MTDDVVRVWDPVVRVFHWGLVAAFATAWLSAEESSEVHELAGYAVIALLAVRLVWGFVGPRYARFAQFVRGPGDVAAYARASLTGQAPRHLGHNPLGGAMVVALFLTVGGAALTGWAMTDPAREAWLMRLTPVAAAFADDHGGRGGESLEEVHELLANLALILVGLHVAGVALSSLGHHENLVRGMITGDKRAPEPGDVV